MERFSKPSENKLSELMMKKRFQRRSWIPQHYKPIYDNYIKCSVEKSMRLFRDENYKSFEEHSLVFSLGSCEAIELMEYAENHGFGRISDGEMAWKIDRVLYRPHRVDHLEINPE